ncbi:MAG: serine hydrolase domain-containing protein [Terracidiphilus sp.]|jgi:CubicO group peptidase (beta-lactamase class C family)
MKKQFALTALLVGVSLLTGAQSAAVPGDNAKQDAIQSYLQPLVANQTIAGAVTLVSNKDQTVYLETVGYRDLAAKIPMPTNAMFWIASTSKPMTATAVMMLVDEGKINLDDPVEKYLPEFHGMMVGPADPDSKPTAQGAPDSRKTVPLVPASHPILVREILSHTSGLPFHSTAEPGVLDSLPLKDAVHSYATDPLIYQPGTDYKYSNEGINTAARIIEVVTGMPYERFMQERLFDPLGMKDTTFWPNAEQINRLAQAYKLDPQTKGLVEVPVAQLTYPLNDRQHRFPMPAGGLFSTAEDVSKFCRMILNGGELNGKRIISTQSLHAMTIPENMGLGKTDYGFAWNITKDGFDHGGAYKNAMSIDTTTGRILVFMVQQQGDWGTKQGGQIVSTLKRLSNDIVSSPTVAPAAGLAPAAH